MKVFLIALGAVLFATLAWAVFVLLFSVVVYRRQTERSLDETDLSNTHYAPYVERLYAEMAEFKAKPFRSVSMTSADGLTLKANYYNSHSNKTAVLVHGYHSTQYNNLSVIGNSLLRGGYNVLLITQRAHGESQGKFTTMGIKEANDLLLWVDWASKNTDATDILVYGVSMGGATVGYASNKIVDPKVKVLVMDCAYTSVRDEMNFNLKKRKVPHLIFTPFYALFSKLFWKIDVSASAIDCLAQTTIPTLFIHGKKDEAVPYRFSVKNYEACGAPKDIIFVEEAGHTASLLVDRDAERKFYDFVTQYIK